MIVVGAGHAGLEAAFAAARVGASVVVVTSSLETAGQTPCNPSVGGVAKGHLVHEIEALGGFMGRAADACAIHGRVLNASKGPAVRATRLQVDKALYGTCAVQALSAHPGIRCVQALVEDLIVEPDPGSGPSGRIAGVVLADGSELRASTVVITTGTFLGGRLHTGSRQVPGGRVGEAPASALSTALRRLGFALSRLKTGTPPRLAKASLDYSRFEPQGSDEPFPRFTAPDEPEQPRQLAKAHCHMVYTNAHTHAIIRERIHESPMYSGQIEGVGPRYCPSIEDKVVRFADRERHLVFLEPEGLDSPLIYPNGISTSLAVEVQEAFIRSIDGLERAEIVCPGYAVEYDAVDARALDHRLASKDIRGLYFAGQINGTSGYEEAGAQGLIAGANAALECAERDAMLIARDVGYVGVMIDDLVTQGCDEPYRMFTSRAEFRLILREDNADERLGAIAHAHGLIDDARAQRNAQRSAQVDTFAHALSRGQTPECDEKSKFLLGRAQARRVYAGYIERQRVEAERLHGEGLPLSPDLQYLGMPGLSTEVAQRLAAVRPTSTAQAARIPGMTPAAVACLWVHARNDLRRSGQSSPA